MAHANGSTASDLPTGEVHLGFRMHSIRTIVTAARDGGRNNDGYADNLGLTIQQPFGVPCTRTTADRRAPRRPTT